jgi:hypothetical protein
MYDQRTRCSWGRMSASSWVSSRGSSCSTKKTGTCFPTLLLVDGAQSFCTCLVSFPVASMHDVVHLRVFVTFSFCLLMVRAGKYVGRIVVGTDQEAKQLFGQA